MPRLGSERTALLELRAGDELIAIHLEKDRHKSVRLRVQPDGTVLVRAPHRVRREDVATWLAGRAAWILERRDYFQHLRQARPQTGYGPGDIQRFLGQEHVLRISGHVRGSVQLDENGFDIRTRGEPSPAKVRTLLDSWFGRQAAALFAQRLEVWFPVLRRHLGEGKGAAGEGAQADAPRIDPSIASPVAPPPLKVRAMRSRYGSCSRLGVITLNRHLAAMPLDCIDYVLVHELCHLRHFAHDRAFYNLLQTILPDWRQRKALLKEYWYAQVLT